MVNAGGYKVHMYSVGEGSPAGVVTGGYSVDWSLVQPEVAKFTRICTYNVAGTAWSGPGPATCKARVSELHTMFNTGGVKPPFVSVGFSLGGLVARFYVSCYADGGGGWCSWIKRSRHLKLLRRRLRPLCWCFRRPLLSRLRILPISRSCKRRCKRCTVGRKLDDRRLMML